MTLLPWVSSNYTIYIKSISLNDKPDEPSKKQKEDDNTCSFVCPLPGLTDFQCRPCHLYWTFNLLCNCPLCKWYSWERHKGVTCESVNLWPVDGKFHKCSLAKFIVIDLSLTWKTYHIFIMHSIKISNEAKQLHVHTKLLTALALHNWSQIHHSFCNRITNAHYGAEFSCHSPIKSTHNTRHIVHDKAWHANWPCKVNFVFPS